MAAVRKAKSALAIVLLAGMTLLAVGCGGGEDGSERAVEWAVASPADPSSHQVRLSASVGWCGIGFPQLERPIIKYEGDRAYIELRHTPEEKKEGQNGCLLELLGLHKTITLKRDLGDLVLYDVSTDPPEIRWPRECWAGERCWSNK
jgi:hypothetical protein